MARRQASVQKRATSDGGVGLFEGLQPGPLSVVGGEVDDTEQTGESVRIVIGKTGGQQGVDVELMHVEAVHEPFDRLVRGAQKEVRRHSQEELVDVRVQLRVRFLR